jgi:hypothetical protein
MWGLGVCLCVALVLAGAYVGRHIATSRAQAELRVGPPTAATVAVVRELRPEAGAAFAVPIGTSTRMILVASSQERSCPTVGPCGPVPPLDQIEVVDVASGATLATQPLTGPAQQAVAVAVDQQIGLIALVAPGAVTTLAADTLSPVGSFSLPTGVAANQSTGAAITENGTLWLTATQNGQATLLGLDERSGQVRATVALANTAAADGPVYDAGDGTLLVLVRQEGAATLAMFSTATGALERQVPVSAGARLGPLTPRADAVYLFGADGTTFRLRLPTDGSAASPAPVPALFGARSLGWGADGQQTYVADTNGVRILSAQSGATLAALSVAVASPPQQALAPIDANGERLLAVLGEHGTVIVMRESPLTAGGMTPDTAALVARAVLLKLVPQDAGDPTPQDPLFLTAETFTPGPGARSEVPFMVRDPDVGWQSAAPGTADIAVAQAAGGAYDITFTVTWTQHHFTHRHVAVLRVAPDGAVRVVSDTGDALP